MKEQIKKLILLDFDGTILDSTDAWSTVYQHYCNQNNFDVSESIILNEACLPFQEWIEAIKIEHTIIETNESIVNSLNKIATVVYNKIPPKDGFIEFINRHKALGTVLIIISREEAELIQNYLEHNQITCVSEVVKDTCKNRMKTDYYFVTAAIYGCKVQDITLIDDSLSHCYSAKQAGAFVIGINDNHSIERQIEMKELCNLYTDDFTTLL